MTRVRVLRPLNVRTGSPVLHPNNNTGDRYFVPGDVIEVDGPVMGESIEGNNIWYRLWDGAFVWSGGVVDAGFKKATDYGGLIGNIPKAWLATSGRNVTIALLDTGFFLDHPDLKHLKQKSLLKDFGDNGNTRDLQGHGTHILGMLAGKAQVEHGVNGMVSDARFLLYKVITDDFGFIDTSVVNAINDAVASGADIINMSFNVSSAEGSPLHQAIRKASEKKILLVSSAGENGNLFKQNLVFPARFEEVIAVGEISEGFAAPGGQALHRAVDFLMPYTDQRSCWNDPSRLYGELKGSSMATGLVSGVLAALVSARGKGVNAVEELKRVAIPLADAPGLNDHLRIFKP